jgi:hypothetical protein
MAAFLLAPTTTSLVKPSRTTTYSCSCLCILALGCARLPATASLASGPVFNPARRAEYPPLRLRASSCPHLPPYCHSRLPFGLSSNCPHPAAATIGQQVYHQAPPRA